MKIEVGMYVRTDRGKIGKLHKELKNYYELEYPKNVYDLIYKNRCLKFNFNPYKLIEFRDLIVVDGIKYTVLQNEKYFDGKLYIERVTQDGCPRFCALSYLITENKIESILTKEQFENISYKVEKLGWSD